MTGATVRAGAAFCFALLSLAACSSAPPDPSEAATSAGSGERGEPSVSEPCFAASESELSESATLQGMVGDFSLSVMSPTGTGPPTSVDGTLALTAHSPEMQRVRAPDGTVRTDALAPLYGWTNIDLGPLRAVPMGGLDSRDPEAPGVGVYETRSGGLPSIVLRLGSDANRREGNAIDGATTVLRVLRIEDGYFSGSWRSAVGIREQASGFFCARRVTTP